MTATGEDSEPGDWSPGSLSLARSSPSRPEPPPLSHPPAAVRSATCLPCVWAKSKCPLNCQAQTSSKASVPASRRGRPGASVGSSEVSSGTSLPGTDTFFEFSGRMCGELSVLQPYAPGTIQMLLDEDFYLREAPVRLARRDADVEATEPPTVVVCSSGQVCEGDVEVAVSLRDSGEGRAGHLGFLAKSLLLRSMKTSSSHRLASSISVMPWRPSSAMRRSCLMPKARSILPLVCGEFAEMGSMSSSLRTLPTCVGNCSPRICSSKLRLHG